MIRVCLGVRVVPVFAPPRETGFQAAIEAFNGRWQRKLWARSWDPSLAALQARSARYIAATRSHSADQIEGAPPRLAAAIDTRVALRGRLLFIRRTSDTGTVRVLGRRYPVDPYCRAASSGRRSISTHGDLPCTPSGGALQTTSPCWSNSSKRRPRSGCADRRVWHFSSGRWFD